MKQKDARTSQAVIDVCLETAVKRKQSWCGEEWAVSVTTGVCTVLSTPDGDPLILTPIDDGCLNTLASIASQDQRLGVGCLSNSASTSFIQRPTKRQHQCRLVWISMEKDTSPDVSIAGKTPVVPFSVLKAAYVIAWQQRDPALLQRR